MSINGRTEKAMKIMFSQNLRLIVEAVMGFISRTIFVTMLGADYLGLNGLFASILSTLSLAELGFGSAIGYHLYKPVSEKNYEEINKLLAFYKKIYYRVGSFILMAGLCLTPFLQKLINFDNAVDINVYVIYVMFLINTVFSYFVSAYMTVLANADQRGDVLYNIASITKIVTTIGCSVGLLITHNYYVYLSVQIAVSLGSQVITRFIIQKMYPFVKRAPKKQLERRTVQRIYSDVSSIMIDRLSNTLSNSFDNMIVSAFVGTALVGRISNYTMISSLVIGVAASFASSSYAGIGNLVASSDVDHQIKVYKLMDFINYYILFFCANCLCILLSPFVSLWLGTDYVIDFSILFCIIFDAFIYNLLWPTWGFKDGMGLFKYGRFLKLIRGIINIILSVVICFSFGAFGVYFASLITNLFITLPMFIFVVYKHGFKRSSRGAIIRVYLHVVFTFACILLTRFLCGLLGKVNFVTFGLMILISVIVPNTIFYLVYHHTEEWKEMENRYIKKIVLRICHK